MKSRSDKRSSDLVKYNSYVSDSRDEQQIYKMEEKRWKVELHTAALFIAAMVSDQAWWLYNPSTQKSEAGGWP